MCAIFTISHSLKKQHLILTDWQIYTQIRFGFKNNSSQEQLSRRDVMKMTPRNRNSDFPISHGVFVDWVYWSSFEMFFFFFGSFKCGCGLLLVSLRYFLHYAQLYSRIRLSVCFSAILTYVPVNNEWKKNVRENITFLLDLVNCISFVELTM